VALCGRREEDGQAIANTLDASGNRALFVQCDVTDYESQANLFRTVWQKWGRLDVLIANAGCVDRGSVYNFARRHAAVDDLPCKPDLSSTDIDLKGTIYGTTLATHFMRNNPGNKGGKILVTGSMIGVYPCPTFPEYCAAKAAVHQWVRTMAPVLAVKEHITINCIMPGGVDTAAMPDFSTAFRPEQLTLRSNIIRGYDVFLDDAENTRTGETLEAAHDTLISWGKPEFKSGAFAKRTEKVYDPWFALIHGETSDLPEALKGPPARGPKIIAITGATGSQGGGVVNVMKKVGGWKVRAITRNPESEAAKKLATEGIEVVQASFDDEASLTKAFEVSSSLLAHT
jgi:NAD(P)-dependent dehydrogenase (short-subunit alcohol dehydrogenase family)